jgi:WD40 repeat protein
MISSSKSQEIIYWDLNLKSEKSILSIFEEEHENIIDVVIFAPQKTAKTIIKSKLDKDNDTEDQTGFTEEESKVKELESNGGKDNTKLTSLQLKAQQMKEMREKLASKKKGIGTKTKDDNEEDKKEEDDIEVKDDFVASGSRDKKIKLWNCKRGI